MWGLGEEAVVLQKVNGQILEIWIILLIILINFGTIVTMDYEMLTKVETSNTIISGIA